MDPISTETGLVRYIISEKKSSEWSCTKNYPVMNKLTVWPRGLCLIFVCCAFMALPIFSYAQNVPHIRIISQQSTRATLQCTRASTPGGCHGITWTVNGEVVNGRPGFQISTNDCWSHLVLPLSDPSGLVVVKCTVKTSAGDIEDSNLINISVTQEGTPTIPTTGVWPATSSVNDMVTGSWSDDSEESEGMDNTASSTMMSATESGSNLVTLEAVIGAIVVLSTLAVPCVVAVLMIHYRNKLGSIFRSCRRTRNGETHEVVAQESQNLGPVIAQAEKWEVDDNREESEKFSVPKSKSNETAADLSGHNEQKFQPREPSHRANRRDILNQQQMKVATSTDSLHSAIDIPEREEAKSTGDCEMMEGDGTRNIEFHHHVDSRDDILSFSAHAQPKFVADTQPVEGSV